MNTKFNYWYWFFKGSGGKPGYRRLFDRWIFIHLVIGLIMSFLVPACLEQAANAVLFPLASIFIALSFAWAVNAQALMQSDEINELSQHHEGGFEDYIFIYQAAVLTILVTLVLWGLAGLKIFDVRWPTPDKPKLYFSLKTLLFFMFSLTLRECWHVVIGTHWLLIAQREIKRHKKK